MGIKTGNAGMTTPQVRTVSKTGMSTLLRVTKASAEPTRELKTLMAGTCASGIRGKERLMANHPNRKKVYADTTFQNAARAAGATVRCLWEIPGPKDTEIAWITFYQINQSCCIVETFKDGGWNAFTPNTSIDVDATIADALSRCGVPATATLSD